MKKQILITLSLAAALTSAAVADSASAMTHWQHQHPRRVEVNARLDYQHHRIAEERREGDLTRRQARELRSEDRHIRAEERFDAARHHGHLTWAEQHRLNRQENQVSRRIGR